MLSEEVIHSFNLKGEIMPLPGGQNTSVRVNNAVLKPVEDVQHSERLLTIIDSLNPHGYRLSKPVRSNKGTFVSEGWICTQFEHGQEVNGLVKEKLQASRLFHHDLSTILVSNLPQVVDNAWAKAHRIAWQTAELPKEVHIETRQIITELLLKVRLQEDYTLQVVHADLAGNILFDEVLPPLIIDFSPTIAPVEYAEAILVCDCIAWQGSKASEIDVLPNHEFYKEMVIRAVVFRLAVEAIFSGKDFDRFIQQYRLFKPIVDYIDKQHSRYL
ncbi:hypothetical protein EBB07_26255 [Paenibacillaceae bacterium]|nr:hypothetical protein EBB07_26255 [Paenibacillaceae bacterium]